VAIVRFAVRHRDRLSTARGPPAALMRFDVGRRGHPALAERSASGVATGGPRRSRSSL
jgi:hypothetical protein